MYRRQASFSCSSSLIWVRGANLRQAYHVLNPQIFKIGLSATVMEETAGQYRDPSWGKSDADIADSRVSDVPSRAKPRTKLDSSKARLVSGTDIKLLLKLTNVKVCSTKTLLDNVLAPARLKTASAGAGVGRAARRLVIDEHLDALPALLGPTCLGVTRHDLITAITEGNNTQARRLARLPCAELADVIDGDDAVGEAQFNKWMTDLAGAMVLIPTSESDVGALDSDIVANAIGTIGTQYLTSFLGNKFNCGQQLRDVLGSALLAADTPAPVFLEELFAKLGPRKSIPGIFEAERAAISEWAHHGMTGTCGHAHCLSITKLRAKSAYKRFRKYVASHPQLTAAAAAAVSAAAAAAVSAAAAAAVSAAAASAAASVSAAATTIAGAATAAPAPPREIENLSLKSRTLAATSAWSTLSSSPQVGIGALSSLSARINVSSSAGGRVFPVSECAAPIMPNANLSVVPVIASEQTMKQLNHINDSPLLPGRIAEVSFSVTPGVEKLQQSGVQ
jgi:hypothetical protein